MRRTLGTLVATAVLLTGCGASGDTDRSAEPAPPTRSSTAPDEQPSPTAGPVQHRLVELVSASHVGGQVSPRALVLDSKAGIAELTKGFDGPRMADLVEAAVDRAEVGPDETLVGAVVAIGCDAPTDVSVERRRGRLLIHPGKIPTTKQCLVPVTTVALVAVPSSAV